MGLGGNMKEQLYQEYKKEIEKLELTCQERDNLIRKFCDAIEY